MYKKTLIFRNKKHYERFMDKMGHIKTYDSISQNDFKKAYELANKIGSILVKGGHGNGASFLPNALLKLAEDPNNSALYNSMKRQLDGVEALINACVKSEPILKQIKSIIK